ncbi:4-hydroxy-tetrahydrodipicolinate synthase [Aestuariibacter salexigens]|uniref:4-hydroxy-tetrahydrodipicolinate synthase n=1 Tax=Aestuariibacter salexigens TaxID=226010 RepID=UPI00040779BF|nr:4-hydroxy-tetrahydrodipicolinate synthase [Aestuariibacter salexigens]
MFKGSFVALITPMHANGEVDYGSLKRLVDFHLEQGSHGLVAVGTTGESATLPFDEHVNVVSKIVEYADNRIPVIAGSGANSTDEAIFLSQQMADTGVNGFLSVVPYYNKPQQRGMIAHFTAIAEATDLPVVLYNVPGRTVADMQPETVKILAQHPNIVGIKDATGDLRRLAQMRALIADQDFVYLSGDDPTSCEFLASGGHGVISVTANVVPNAMAQMCELAAAGQFDEARHLDQQLAALHKGLFIEPNPVMPKWALYKMGLIESDFLRLPMVQAELDSQNELESIMRACALI